MANGKGVGAPTIIAVAFVSTVVTILLDKTGITAKVEELIRKVVK